MKLNKLIAIATISLLSGGISMAQKALNLEDIVAGNVIQTKRHRKHDLAKRR